MDKLEDVRIVCPQCKVKQNGIIKHHEYGSAVLPYIQCCRPDCKFIIVSDDLEEVTRHVVRYPSDLRTIKP